jgi:Rieske Fe-S protein
MTGHGTGGHGTGASRPPRDPENPGRRRLFIAAAFTACGGLVASVAAVVGRFVLAPLGARRAGGARADLGAAKAFDVIRFGAEGPQEVVLKRTVEDGYMTRRVRERLAIVRDTSSPSGLAVLSMTCTHLGCAVSWSSERSAFLCPCHGGVYAADGTVTAGPPPRPLRRLPFVIEGGRVRVDSEELA